MLNPTISVCIVVYLTEKFYFVSFKLTKLCVIVYSAVYVEYHVLHFCINDENDSDYDTDKHKYRITVHCLHNIFVMSLI